MNKRYQFLIGASLSLAAFSFAQNALAQTCVTPPTCQELGYTDTADRCVGTAMLKCPFDTSKVFCREKKYIKVCDTVGDVLLDNRLCAYDISDMDPKRTPIGVVFDVERKLAIALEESEKVQWSSNFFDLSSILPSYSTALSYLDDYSGKESSAKIFDYCQSQGYSCPAVEYAHSYKTISTNVGDWYLPAAGELQLIYNNLTPLNQSLSKIGGSTLQWQFYWSCTRMGANYMWAVTFNQGRWGANRRTSTSYARPVINY